MALSDPLFNPTELRKLAQDNGPEYAGRSRRALRWCADVLEAADVVVQESRGDDALIQQLVEVLCECAEDSQEQLDRMEAARLRDYKPNAIAWQEDTIAKAKAAIVAGRARLEGKP